jgi:RimJ/RimL family protein N-acetyltransferase
VIAVAPTRDFARIRELLAQPAQWDAATDDSAPAPKAFWPNEDERIIYLEAAAFGIFTMIPQNAICYEIHVAANIAQIKTATAALEAAIAWAFENTPARRIIAQIPATNRLAIALATRAGLVEFGRNPGSFLKRGELVDVHLLGISK